MNQRTILVSGASKGLGLEIVKHFLAEPSTNVVAFARRATPDMKELCAATPHRLTFTEADVTDHDATNRIVREAVDRYGRVDVLINNAGIAADGLLATTPASAIEQVVAVNVTGALTLARHAVRPMLRQGEGNIINIASLAAFAAFRGLSVYAATKASLVAFTRTLAREVGPSNIRVNCVAPGYLRTDMTATLGEDYLNAIRRRTPLGRLGDASEIVDVVSFLASPRSRFITGQTLVVDGGLSC